MHRRDFLLRLGQAAALAAVMDPLELIERLAPRRLYVPGADFTSRLIVAGNPMTDAKFVRLLKQIYLSPVVRVDDYVFLGVYPGNLGTA